MSDYHEHGITVSPWQAKKIVYAANKGSSVSIKLLKKDLQGSFKLPLTQTQINKINKAQHGIVLKLSESQLKHLQKTGGILPLLPLLGLAGALAGGVGGLAGGIASAVNSSKQTAEQERHNRAIESQLKADSGVVANVVGNIPIIGGPLKTALEKIGLGVCDINKIKKGGCICKNGYVIGTGLYLSPQGEKVGRGLFLGPFLG